MAVTGVRDADVRDIRSLAKRVHQRWLEYRRRHAGMSVPITDTLSRILEHDPEYQPVRGRLPTRQRPPLQNPGVFTLKTVADALDTTVGDLLGEPGFTSLREAVSPADRRKLLEAVDLLRDLFDLDDEALREPATRAAQEADPFFVPATEFLARDHDYPSPLHAWLVREGAAVSEQREMRDSRMFVVRVVGDSMEPELRDGWKILIDTARTTPEEHALVAVYVRGRGAFLGRWRMQGSTVSLVKSNPHYPPITFAAHEQYVVWGTATTIVDAPLIPRP